MSEYTLPLVPDHPEPRHMRWTDLERKAISDHGHACAEHVRAPLLARIAELKAERDADRRREYGYSQETVDAISGERDRHHAEVEDWRKLLDPVNLFVNLLQGKPAQLTKAQLAHLLGQDYTALLAEVEALRAALSQCATAVGASAATDCSVEFLSCVPREVELVVEKLRAAQAQAKADEP